MRVHELNEGVEVDGDELLAYTITVAEIFSEKPEFEPGAAMHWEALLASNEKMAARVLGGLNVEYVNDDPYRGVKDLIADVILNKRLKVFKTPESKHPMMDDAENDVFRALHDALAHVGGNSQAFREFMDKSGPGANPRDYQMNHGSGFTVRGEMNAYVTHARMAPRDAVPALFTEIVGQICTYFVTGDFTVDKVVVLDGVDFRNVGVLYGKRATRMQEILDDINDPDIQYINTRVHGIRLDKNKIRWKMLSRGLGRTRGMNQVRESAVIGSGLWISPRGDVVSVGQKHITDIVVHPEKFGMSEMDVKMAFKKHGEEVNAQAEGDAREELIGKILKKGWIRVRGYRSYVSLTVSRMTPQIKENIRNFVVQAVQKNDIHKFDEVRIVELDGIGGVKKLEAEKIMKFALEEAVKEQPYFRSIRDLPDMPITE